MRRRLVDGSGLKRASMDADAAGGLCSSCDSPPFSTLRWGLVRQVNMKNNLGKTETNEKDTAVDFRELTFRELRLML